MRTRTQYMNKGVKDIADVIYHKSSLSEQDKKNVATVLFARNKNGEIDGSFRFILVSKKR